MPDQLDQWDKANSIKEINSFWDHLPKEKINFKIYALLYEGNYYHIGSGTSAETDIIIAARKLKEQGKEFKIVELAHE
jgi:hypothetical protein